MKKKSISIIGIVLLILISFINIGQSLYNNNQSIPASVLDVTFQGEYRIGEGPWKPIVEGEHIPASKGDVQLRGTLQKCFPDGEIVEPVMNEERITLYFDHLGGSVFVNGEEVHVFDAENPMLGNSTCGKHWTVYQHMGTEQDTIEIHLTNPHKFGNELAVDKFLDFMKMYAGDSIDASSSEQAGFVRKIGYIVVVIAVLMLGVALFSSLIHLHQSRYMWSVGAAILFAGCYFVVSSVETYVWYTNIALNTAIYVLSIMLYVCSLQDLVVQCFKQVLRKKGNVLVILSEVCTGLLILYATISRSKLYDMLHIWVVCQMIISGLLLILCCKNLRYREGQIKKAQILFMGALVCLILDAVATWAGWWQGVLCSSFVFVIMFVGAIFVVLLVIPKSIRAMLREKEIEAELEKRKTAVMLSQIQPHFLYNSLGAIRELCRQDPEDARNALTTFITYLRGNMDSIQRGHTVPFSKELDHISAYLELEKMRFGEDLNVVFDIQETGFAIPTLTVQPLVENAVKHGICGREEGGTLILHTHREGETVVIRIQDDGVGFDTKNLEDMEHVGLTNVRNRLKYIVNGELSIESQPGAGTIATITIRDRKD